MCLAEEKSWGEWWSAQDETASKNLGEMRDRVEKRYKIIDSEVRSRNFGWMQSIGQQIFATKEDLNKA